MINRIVKWIGTKNKNLTQLPENNLEIEMI